MQWRIQGGGGRIGRGPPPPLFSADFCFFWPILADFRGAEWRNLDSRPPLFTDPGSATAMHITRPRSVSKTIPGGPAKKGTVDILGLCSDQQLSFFTLLDRTSFPHYNNTKIIKFG